MGQLKLKIESLKTMFYYVLCLTGQCYNIYKNGNEYLKFCKRKCAIVFNRFTVFDNSLEHIIFVFILLLELTKRTS